MNCTDLVTRRPDRFPSLDLGIQFLAEINVLLVRRIVWIKTDALAIEFFKKFAGTPDIAGV